jgi:hypothetical protein
VNIGSTTWPATGTRKPLWVVGADGGALRAAERYMDLWSNVTELPRYRSPVDDQDLYTSVLIPMVPLFRTRLQARFRDITTGWR